MVIYMTQDRRGRDWRGPSDQRSHPPSPFMPCPGVVDVNLAWEMIDAVRDHLDARRRNNVYIAITSGDAFWVVGFLLNTVANTELPLHAELIWKLRSWVTAYRDHPDESALRHLIEQIASRPADPASDIPASPTFLTTTAKYKSRQRVARPQAAIDTGRHTIASKAHANRKSTATLRCNRSASN